MGQSRDNGWRAVRPKPTLPPPPPLGSKVGRIVFEHTQIELAILLECAVEGDRDKDSIRVILCSFAALLLYELGFLYH